MALNDITFKNESGIPLTGAKKVNVAAGVTINAGEPVARALAGSTVTPLATNKPVVGTDYMEGVAVSTSTATATLAGTVDVLPLLPGIVYIAAPNVAATFDTQAEYDALVGDRVLFDLTSGVYTILAADGATNGLVIEPLDITKYPGKVAFSIRSAVNVLA